MQQEKRALVPCPLPSVEAELDAVLADEPAWARRIRVVALVLEVAEN